MRRGMKTGWTNKVMGKEFWRNELREIGIVKERKEGGWGRGMKTGQTNNRDRKTMRENGGKKFKTQRGKGTTNYFVRHL
jgi:hypothetical protein